MLKRTAGVEFSLMNQALMPDREPTSRAGLIEMLKEELDRAKAYHGEGFDPCLEVLKEVAEAKLPAYAGTRT